MWMTFGIFLVQEEVVGPAVAAICTQYWKYKGPIWMVKPDWLNILTLGQLSPKALHFGCLAFPESQTWKDNCNCLNYMYDVITPFERNQAKNWPKIGKKWNSVVFVQTHSSQTSPTHPESFIHLDMSQNILLQVWVKDTAFSKHLQFVSSIKG